MFLIAEPSLQLLQLVLVKVPEEVAIVYPNGRKSVRGSREDSKEQSVRSDGLVSVQGSSGGRGKQRE